MPASYDPDKDHLHFEPEVDRDIMAIVVAVLQDMEVGDIATIIGDIGRAPMMLIRACQFLAETTFYRLPQSGGPAGGGPDAALRHFQHQLLHYGGLPPEGDTNAPEGEGGTDAV